MSLFIVGRTIAAPIQGKDAPIRFTKFLASCCTERGGLWCAITLRAHHASNVTVARGLFTAVGRRRGGGEREERCLFYPRRAVKIVSHVTF